MPGKILRPNYAPAEVALLRFRGQSAPISAATPDTASLRCRETGDCVAWDMGLLRRDGDAAAYQRHVEKL